ncbi:hypothetical protein, partial [Metabacillus halosaccharovorans]|uniref:hypothetical protein n=1 Tax=Metabacillus halosaccharovorans TaxID=930124 RepID=UPI00203B5453
WSPPWLPKLGVNSVHDLTPRIIPRGLFFVQVPENPSNRNAPLLKIIYIPKHEYFYKRIIFPSRNIEQSGPSDEDYILIGSVLLFPKVC